MGLVAQAFGFGDGELAFVDFGRRRDRAPRAPRVARGSMLVLALPDRVAAAQSSSSGVAAHNNAMAAGSVSYRRDVNPDGAAWVDLRCRLVRRQTLQRWALVLAIELKSKRFAEGGERPFGGIGFGGLESDVVNLARRGATAFARAMAFADNGCSIGLHGNAHFGDIDGEEDPRFSRARTQRDSTVSRFQPSKPKIRLASEIAYQPSI